ncbi:MAG: 4-hydroxy-tetrahydrodipicolinate reductase [Clostridia bacterium]|nr:4-hydroxy-tetrahydrodipicolinate reductase [Clostridia bacterium]
MENKIRVIITGAAGRMGREMSKGLLQSPGVEVVGAVDRVGLGQDIGTLNGLPALGIAISDNLEEVINKARPRVMVDFTVAEAAYHNARIAINHGVSPVIGTTGMDRSQIDELHILCEEKQIGAVIAPNFALGAVLMMLFARQAARFLPQVEVIEIHHDGKLDAPSGTALKTIDMIADARPDTPQPSRIEQEKAPGSRGGCYRDVRVHSLRLPGAVAHQEVIFGGLGQLLTIRHDTTSREAFLPGVLLAIEKVINLKGVVFGLENLLDL